MKELKLSSAVRNRLCRRYTVSKAGTLCDEGIRGAFAVGETLRIQLSLPRALYPQNAELLISRGKPHGGFEPPVRLSASEKSSIGGCEVYIFDIPTNAEAGIYFYRFEYTAGREASVFAVWGDISEHIEPAGEFSPEKSYRLMLYNAPKTEPSACGDIIYHIFVDRFRSSGNCPKRADAILENNWYGDISEYAENPGDDINNNHFFGGDLYGIIEKLDYISSLGVGIIYLSPIFEAYSNHKYDTGDYFKVDEMFGGNEAFDALVRETEKRGIKIILDGVFNHTGSDSLYFNKNGRYGNGGAYKDAASPYRTWYNFYEYPDNYECWWGIKILPRLTDAARTFITGEGGVVRHWLEKGAYGWRLDVADELSEKALHEIKQSAGEARADGIIIGEVWEDASDKMSYGSRRGYFLGGELDSVMNYPLRVGLISWLLTGNAESLRRGTELIYSHYPPQVNLRLMNIIGTHDTERISTVLSGREMNGSSGSELRADRMSESEKEKSLALQKLAYFTLVALPGMPCIYYGDEIGLEGRRDPFNRRTYPWEREGEKGAELKEYYRSLGELRKNSETLRRGGFEPLYCDENAFCFLRTGEKGSILAAVNRTSEAFEIKLKLPMRDMQSGAVSKTHILAPLSALMLESEHVTSAYDI